MKIIGSQLSVGAMSSGGITTMIDRSLMVENITEAEENRRRIRQLQEDELSARLQILAHDHFLRAEVKAHRGGFTPLRFGKETIL